MRTGSIAKTLFTAALVSMCSAACGSGGNVTIHGSLAIDRPDWNPLTPTSQRCGGYAGFGYGDLSPGGTVIVYNPDHKVIGTGALQPGSLINVGRRNSQCVMRFTITKLPKESVYGVAVTNRGTVEFSSAQVAANHVALTIGGT